MIAQPDLEVFAALQADVAAERAAEVEDLRARIRTLEGALLDAFMERAGFEKVAEGRHRRDGSLGNLFGWMPLTPEEAQKRLAALGIQVTITPVEEDQP